MCITTSIDLVQNVLFRWATSQFFSRAPVYPYVHISIYEYDVYEFDQTHLSSHVLFQKLFASDRVLQSPKSRQFDHQAWKVEQCAGSLAKSVGMVVSMPTVRTVILCQLTSDHTMVEAHAKANENRTKRNAMEHTRQICICRGAALWIFIQGHRGTCNRLMKRDPYVSVANGKLPIEEILANLWAGRQDAPPHVSME